MLPPEYFDKDVNDLVNAGVPVEELPELFKNNAYQGLMAEMRYASWKKQQFFY